MTREIFIKQLETYQTSQAPMDVKEKAIARLHNQFLGSNQDDKNKEILIGIINSTAELKSTELYFN